MIYANEEFVKEIPIEGFQRFVIIAVGRHVNGTFVKVVYRVL